MKSGPENYVSAEIDKKILKMVGEKRFIHCRSVAATAVEIAKKYGLNIKKAAVAGMLHDCARGLSRGKSSYYINKYKIRLDHVSKKIPALWHSFIGPYVAMEEFKIRDRSILDAIKYHTAGNTKMGPIAKAVYISDYAEINRKYHTSIKIRAKIKTNIPLDELVRLVLKDKLSYLIEEGKLVHFESLEMWNKYNHKI